MHFLWRIILSKTRKTTCLQCLKVKSFKRETPVKVGHMSRLVKSSIVLYSGSKLPPQLIKRTSIFLLIIYEQNFNLTLKEITVKKDSIIYKRFTGKRLKSLIKIILGKFLFFPPDFFLIQKKEICKLSKNSPLEIRTNRAGRWRWR